MLLLSTILNWLPATRPWAEVEVIVTTPLSNADVETATPGPTCSIYWPGAIAGSPAVTATETTLVDPTPTTLK